MTAYNQLIFILFYALTLDTFRIETIVWWQLNAIGVWSEIFSESRIPFATQVLHDCRLRWMRPLIAIFIRGIENYYCGTLTYVSIVTVIARRQARVCPDWRERITSKCIYIKKMKILGENANLFNVTVVIYVRRVYTGRRERLVAYISYLYLATRCILRFRTFTCIFHRAPARNTYTYTRIPFYVALYLYVLSWTCQARRATCSFAPPLSCLLSLFYFFLAFTRSVSSFSFNLYRQWLKTARIHMNSFEKSGPRNRWCSNQ